MIDQRFVAIGVILSFYGGLTYVVATLRGRTKPNRVTWLLWFFIPLVAFFAEVKQGVVWQSTITLMAAFNPLVVLIASFVSKKSEWKISSLDIICAALSLFGLWLWYITQVGNFAIILSILADFMAGLPTVIKAFNIPETEDYRIYFFGAINAIIVLLTIKRWTFAYYGFPLYIFFITVCLVILIRYRVGKRLLR